MTNYLIGKGELLVTDTIGGGRKVDKAPVYTFSEARSRLQPMIVEAARSIDSLPAEACPDDQAVAALTVNPEYTSRNPTFRPNSSRLSGSLRSAAGHAE